MNIGFSNTIFAFALLGIGLPILIHFLTRPRPRRILLPTFQFLIEVGRGRQALDRLRTILVLAVRCILLAALVMMFTRPYRYLPAFLDDGEQKRKIVVLLDASLSMQAMDGPGSLFDRARSEAAELLRRLDEETEAAVILMKAKPEMVLPTLSRNIPMLYRSLQTVVPSFESGSPREALALAQRLLTDSGGGTIYAFSDFQRSQWQSAFAGMPADIPVVVRPMINRPIDNLAVTAVSVRPQRSVAGEPVEITATIYNGTGAEQQIPVRLDYFGETRRNILTIPAYQRGNALFTIKATSPGAFQGTIHIDRDDALTPDNVRHFKVNIQPEAHVLIIGDDSPDDPSGGTFFLMRALTPVEGHPHGLNVTHHHTQDVHVHALNQADAILMVSPALVSRDIAQSIGRKVQEGAVLVCSLDGRDAPLTIDMLAAASGGKLEPPFTLLGPARTLPEGAGLKDIDCRRYPLKLFRHPEDGGLSGLRFRRHYLTTVEESRRSDIRMWHDDGAAAFSVGSVGQGTAIFMNFPLTRNGGNLVRTPLFPIMIHEALKTNGTRQAGHETRPGQSWQIRFAREGDEMIQVQGPDGKPVKFRHQVLGVRMCLTMAPARLPGVYRIMQADRTRALGIVNPDGDESDLKPLPGASLVEATAPAGNIIIEETPVHLATALSFRKHEEIWPWIGLLVLLATGLEVAMLAFWPRSVQRRKT
jgi:hypothetical protein